MGLERPVREDVEATANRDDPVVMTQYIVCPKRETIGIVHTTQSELSHPWATPATSAGCYGRHLVGPVASALVS